MERLELEILGISFSQSQSGAYALILGEIKGNRRLPVIIGSAEAQSIAIELEKIKPSRPLTHDLIKSFCQAFGIKLEEVIIYRFSEGVFYARLMLYDEDNRLIEIDARTSDAVALAIRFKCPMYTNESVLRSAGVILDEEEMETIKTPVTHAPGEDPSFDVYTFDELEELLHNAVAKEDYETASTLRDVINKRKKQ